MHKQIVTTYMLSFSGHWAISIVNCEWQRISLRCCEAKLKWWRIISGINDVINTSFRYTLNVSFFNIYLQNEVKVNDSSTLLINTHLTSYKHYFIAAYCHKLPLALTSAVIPILLSLYTVFSRMEGFVFLHTFKKIIHIKFLEDLSFWTIDYIFSTMWE